MVLADTMHKPGFKLQARILHHLFGLASSEVIRAPLWDVATTSGGVGAFPNNAAFVHSQLTILLQTSFPNLRPQQIEVCAGIWLHASSSTLVLHFRMDLCTSALICSHTSGQLPPFLWSARHPAAVHQCAFSVE